MRKGERGREERKAAGNEVKGMVNATWVIKGWGFEKFTIFVLGNFGLGFRGILRVWVEVR